MIVPFLIITSEPLRICNPCVCVPLDPAPGPVKSNLCPLRSKTKLLFSATDTPSLSASDLSLTVPPSAAAAVIASPKLA